MPRWSEADDAAVRAADAARDRAGRGSAWPEVHCPDRGTISGVEAQKRFHRINSRAAAPAPARQTRRSPIQQRAENAGVNLRPTPSGVREVIADKDAPAAAADAARFQLRKHQKEVEQVVRRAENKRPAQQAYLDVKRSVREKRGDWAKKPASSWFEYEEALWIVSALGG